MNIIFTVSSGIVVFLWARIHMRFFFFLFKAARVVCVCGVRVCVRMCLSGNSKNLRPISNPYQ